MRARTRLGRLDALDAWLTHEASELLRAGGLVIDVGYGASTVTVESLARAVRQVNPAIEVLGLERDERDGGSALPRAEAVQLMRGGFEALAGLPGAVVVRAMNVLRGYRAEEVPAIHRALGAGLREGGLLLEGSTDTEGHVTVAHLLRLRGGTLVPEGLLFHTDFTRGFSPWLFRDWLPRDLRRSTGSGTPIRTLLDRWSQVVEAEGVGREPRARFTSSVALVAGLEASEWELAHGYTRAVGF